MIDWSGADEQFVETFWRYERALMSNDLSELDRLFAPGPATLRGDAAGLLVGHEQIQAFRGTRGGAPPRVIVEVHTHVIGPDHLLVMAVTRPAAGGQGLQTQLWTRHRDCGWQVTAAHVSAPVPALDRRIWRVVGDPLIPPLGSGPLAGETLAVKDLYAIAGQRTGAGNPAFLEHAESNAEHASVVTSLLAAGASVRGIAQTDEFAYSLAGENIHYGTPPNSRDARRVPGGSSSGPATAVALGQATIGLATDTAGSIRVPSAYQGLYGFRSTHAAISRDGLIPLAPSFDTVGWMTRSASLLASVGDVLLPPGPIVEQPTIVYVPELIGFADESVANAVSGSLPGTAVREDWDLSALVEWLGAFRAAQAAEAWQSHGGWLGDRLETLGPAVRERFAAASQIDSDAAEAARSRVTEACAQIKELVSDRVLALPAASSVAPLIGHAHHVREATLKLAVLASLGGLPAMTIPLETTSGQATAVCLVGARHTDRTLLHLAGRWSQVDH